MRNGPIQTEFSILRQKTGLSIEDVAVRLECASRTLYRYENGETKPRRPVLESLRQLINNGNGDASKPDFTFIDLFAGIGGLRKGFDSIGGRCLFTSEWNKYAQQTYLANFPDGEEHKLVGDITKVDAAEIPEHDVLLAGFPCQPFSIAGVSKKNALGRAHGFNCEAQGTLFFDVARIIDYHRPRAFLLENVKNLVNHDKGRTFKVIRRTLEEELGYHISFRVIDAKRFVPQHRERIFIAGFREKNAFTFDDLIIPDAGPKLRSVLHPEDGSEEAEGHYTKGKKAVVSGKYTLSDHLWDYLQAYAAKHREQGNGFGFGLFGPDDIARTLSARYFKDGSEILIVNGRKNPRRLTPRECARLMGFDALNGSAFKIPVSDTQAYKQFGNAVVVPVVKAVARHMAHWIMSKDAAGKYAQKELLSVHA
jgi:DNA (cytosine-5)-methyltransferase 1